MYSKWARLFEVIPCISRYTDRLGSSALIRQLVLEKENSEFKPV